MFLFTSLNVMVHFDQSNSGLQSLSSCCRTQSLTCLQVDSSWSWVQVCGNTFVGKELY